MLRRVDVMKTNLFMMASFLEGNNSELEKKLRLTA